MQYKVKDIKYDMMRSHGSTAEVLAVDEDGNEVYVVCDRNLSYSDSFGAYTSPTSVLDNDDTPDEYEWDFELDDLIHDPTGFVSNDKDALARLAGLVLVFHEVLGEEMVQHLIEHSINHWSDDIL